MNTEEFLRGQRDCKDGKPHTDQSKSYNRGYAAQYEMEQALSYGGFN
tara:strand:+ start:23009 stop:23149 length:141 start_codon:yes stop_codon:yes gene_type:complete